MYALPEGSTIAQPMLVLPINLVRSSGALPQSEVLSEWTDWGYSLHSEEGSAVFGVSRAHHQDPFSPPLISESTKVFPAISSTQVEIMALAKFL